MDILTVLKSELGSVTVEILLAVLAGGILHFVAGWIGNRVVRLRNRVDRTPTIDEEKRRNTVRNIVVAVLRFVLWSAVVLLILSSLKVNLAAIATGAGFLGLIFGLGAQATIRDILAGLFILFEHQYRVGDVVTLSGGATGTGVKGTGTSGTVEEITLRVTKLRGLDGTLSVVRNGEAAIITNNTINYARVVIDIGVAYDSDIDKVEKVMNEVGEAMQNEEGLSDAIIEPVGFMRVEEFLDSSVVVRAIGMVAPASQWDVAGQYRRRILKAFKKAGIEIPFPQLDVHNRK